MKKFRLSLILLLVSMSAVPALAGNVDVKQVKGTSLSELSDAIEVLRKFSSISFIGDSFYIAGKGKAVVFVDGRRVENHQDLLMLPASYMEKVEIISEQMPEYGNNDGVVLITLAESEDGAFRLNDVAEMTVSPYLGGSNELELSGKKNRFSYEGGLAVSYTGTKDLEDRTIDSYSRQKDNGIRLNERMIQNFEDINKDLSIEAKAAAGWKFSPEHQVNLYYEYSYLKSNGNQANLVDKVYRRTDKGMDLVRPSEVFNAESTSLSGTHKHTVSLGYKGTVEGWKLSVNIDFFGGSKGVKEAENEYHAGKKECTLDKNSDYSAWEGYSRFNAAHALWKGDLTLGLSLDNYRQKTSKHDLVAESIIIDNVTSDLVPGAFFSLKQDFGFMNIDAGLYYRLFSCRYTPMEDDTTRESIIEMMGTPYISYSTSCLHPNLTLSAPVGKGRLTAGAQVTTEFPQLEALAIELDKLKKDDASEAIAHPGRKDEFFLKGEWEWLQFKGWASHNLDPLFTDIDSANDFNGPDYWSMDWRLSLSPSAGIWESDLTATIHKQWLDMEVVDTSGNLQEPMATLNWVHSLSLPWGMRVDLCSQLRTKGADKNIYYRNVFCKADLSVQQPFLNDRLTVRLGIDNLLRSRDAVSFYTRASDMEFNWNDRLVCRMFRISVKVAI